MPPPDDAATDPAVLACHCTALRQGARLITQLYDRHLAPVGLRTTQFSLLKRLDRPEPVSIHALAESMALDRTTMGRALTPLARDGLLAIAPGRDRRVRCLSLTPAGRERLAAALPLWRQAQAAFEARYGPDEAAALRGALARIAMAT